MDRIEEQLFECSDHALLAGLKGQASYRLLLKMMQEYVDALVETCVESNANDPQTIFRLQIEAHTGKAFLKHIQETIDYRIAERS